MKTATLHDLQTRLDTIVGWLEGGEDVIVKASATSSGRPPSDEPVDWAKSGAFRDRTGERILTVAETAELCESYKGDY
jgi:hypothetical protein